MKVKLFFKIVWIKIKLILHLPIYKKDVFDYAEFFYVGKSSCLCTTLGKSLWYLKCYKAFIKEYFPKYTFENAQRFNAKVVEEVESEPWWPVHEWTDRLRFFNWLKEQYKDDTVEISRWPRTSRN